MSAGRQAQWLTGVFVVVSGPPASGKTTLARALAPSLGLPLIAKDTVKDALMSIIPVPNIETSRILGAASVQAILALAAENSGAVLESVWHRSRAQARSEAAAGADRRGLLPVRPGDHEAAARATGADPRRRALRPAAGSRRNME